MLVSVIVPCYNSARDIEKCLISIMNQSYEEFEIIVIDDGSKDNSKEKILSLAKKDNRIKFISQANSGVSKARNNGILHAKGDYIAFIDSDDYVDKSYLEHLINQVNYDDYDIIISGFCYEQIDGESVKIEGVNFQCDKQKFIDSFYLQCIEKRLTFAPYNKLYKSSLLIENKITFQENLEIREDGIFFLDAFKKSQKISGIKYSEYHYIQHIQSSLISKFHDNEIDINEYYFNRTIESLDGIQLSAKIIGLIYPMFLNMDLSAIRKLYFSKQYSLIKGLKFIYRVVHNNSYRYKRRKLFWVRPKKALKYYRPILVFHFMNRRAAKRTVKNK